ncbi:MAG: hypothetical protein AABW58_02550 [Nanoarchaeota archaeon]
MLKLRKTSLLVFLLILINSFLAYGFEMAPPENFCCGKIGLDKEKITPNQTITNCCDYTTNPESCYQCVLEAKQRIEKARYERNIVIYSSSAFAILLGLSILSFFIVKRNTLDWKDFYKFKISKAILFFVMVITAGLFILLQAMTYDAPANPITIVIVSFFFWPFLLALFFEKLIFKGVNWLQLKDTPFIIAAFIVNVLWIYSIACIISYIFRRKK